MLFSKSRLAQAAAAVLCIGLLSTSAFASAINYGDFSEIPPGGVMYLDVTEDSGTDDPPLFNEPSLSADGNTLDFDPSGFVATSMGGPLDITDGQLNFGFMAVPAGPFTDGTGLTGLSFREGGDFSFAGSGGAGTTVSADLLVTVTITEVDDEVLDVPIVIDDFASFATDLATEGTGPGFWDNSLFIDFGPALAGLPGGFERGATKGEVVLDNQLISNSEDDSLAFIAKKDFVVEPVGDLDPNFIPEPASALLLLLGSFAAVGRCRR